MEELRRLNAQLTALLADAHPGLAAWRMELARVLLDLAMFSGVGPVIDAAKAERERLG
jgi:hypothetical protein